MPPMSMSGNPNAMPLSVSGLDASPAPHHRLPHSGPIQYAPPGYGHPPHQGHAPSFPPEASMLQGADPSSQFVSKLTRSLHAGAAGPQRRQDAHEEPEAVPRGRGRDQLPLRRR